ncbi:uncharacterized protein LOC141653493 [Silene latifolia]|uniref:uncharacterized protein LOC141653493 n=1 Tax=Silene latifolia TaxID=37657 RepID=UPI003D7871DF
MFNMSTFTFWQYENESFNKYIARFEDYMTHAWHHGFTLSNYEACCVVYNGMNLETHNLAFHLSGGRICEMSCEEFWEFVEFMTTQCLKQILHDIFESAKEGMEAIKTTFQKFIEENYNENEICENETPSYNLEPTYYAHKFAPPWEDGVLDEESDDKEEYIFDCETNAWMLSSYSSCATMNPTSMEFDVNRQSESEMDESLSENSPFEDDILEGDNWIELGEPCYDNPFDNGPCWDEEYKDIWEPQIDTLEIILDDNESTCIECGDFDYLEDELSELPTNYPFHVPTIHHISYNFCHNILHMLVRSITWALIHCIILCCYPCLFISPSHEFDQLLRALSARDNFL